MVHVSKAFPDSSVDNSKINSAHGTPGSVVENAVSPRFPIPFVAIHRHSSHGSFEAGFVWINFLRAKLEVVFGDNCESSITEKAEAL